MNAHLAMRLLPLLAVLCLLPGCTKRETDAEAGIRTQTLLVGNGDEPASFDPQVATTGNEFPILAALFEGLTAIDAADTKPVPAVAERWEVSPDGLAYTFHLRNDARWSSGDPVTATDFACAFQRLLSPELAAPAAELLWCLSGAKEFNSGKTADFAQVGIRTLDDRTLRLELAHPTPQLPAILAHPSCFPVHRGTITKFGAMYDRTSRWTRPGNLVGNGPFTLAEWRPGAWILVRKNPHYRDAEHTRLQQIRFFPIDSQEAEERNFRAGQLHLTFGVPIPKITSFHTSKAAKLQTDPMLNVRLLEFNLRRPPLDNPKVRRALALAIDREAIVTTVFAETRTPAAHLIPPGCGGFVSVARQPTDSATARRLLAEAGFPGGQGFPPLELLVGNNLEQPKVAEMLQEMWRRTLGISVRISAMETKVKLQAIAMRSFDIAFIGIPADYVDPRPFLAYYVTGHTYNDPGWSNRDFDDLLASVDRTPDPDRRFALLQQAEGLLLDEAPIAPVYFDPWVYLLHPAVKNFRYSRTGLPRYQRVWLEP